MPNSVWTGSLSLGMVFVPVRLYPAIRKQAVRFHELDRGDRRVRHVRVAEPNVEWEPPSSPPAVPKAESALRLEPERARRADSPGRPLPTFDGPAPEVAFEEIRKGYEVAPGRYVSMTREEVAALAPERTRVIYYESRYYVVPDRDWSSPFRLLRQAMAAADRMAIAWFTLRSRRYLSSVRPYGDLMLLTTMVHADEIAAADFWITDDHAAPTDKEMKMARLLIDTLSGPFEPERYPDEHRRRLLEAIDAKAPTEAVAAMAPSPTRVLDLMAALEASVMAARAARKEEDGQPRSRRRRSTGT